MTVQERPRIARPAKAAVNEEILKYFERRTKRLDIAKTTHTPSGQIIDWVPIESQHPEGKIASPPPDSKEKKRAGHFPPGVEGRATSATFELEQAPDLQGPEGTVPVVRKDLSRIATQVSLDVYLAKGRARRARVTAKAPVVAPPDPFGYFHATTATDIVCFGAETVLNVWAPRLERSGDHSISQFGIQNRKDNKKLQSLEMGWEVGHDQYGDDDPHLFVYYTTNGYDEDGDNIGGYNRDVDGWVQVSKTIFPAARLIGLSQRGGGQKELAIKLRYYDDNWWVKVKDEWIGYYPASLFNGGESVFTTLGDHADWAGFWGEVFSSDDDPNVTVCQMGSGSFGESGWEQACYQHSLRIQTDRAGATADFSGATSAENASYYDIVDSPKSGGAWGSYFYAGGPGATIRWAPMGGQWPGQPAVGSNADGRLEVFLRGNDTNLYHLWQLHPNAGWSAPWSPMGGQWKHDPVVARNADGRLEVFAVGNDENLYHRWELPGGGWSQPWTPMGGQWEHQPVVASNADGRLEIFIVGKDTNLYHLWQLHPNGNWSAPWSPMGGQWEHDPVVGRNQDGRLEVFIVGNDENLYHRWELPGGGWSQPWTPMGGQWERQPVVASNADGRMEVFIVGKDQNLYHLWQVKPNAGWSAPWSPMGGQWPGDPAVGRNADGRLEIFIRGNRPYIYHRWQTAPNAGWSGDWLAMHGSWHRDPVVASNQDGRMEVFAVGDDTNLYHAWQTAPSNGWALG